MTSEPGQSGSKVVVCIYCNREFSNFKALCSHLKGCKERKLHRFFDVNGFRFDVTMNPLRRHVKAVRSFQESLKGTNPEKAFVGALLYLKEAGYVFDFKIVKRPVPAPAPASSRAGAGMGAESSR